MHLWMRKNNLMRQIVEIKKLTGGRYLVTLDDGICFPLYNKELDEFNIEEEGILEEEVFCRIMQEVLPKRAKLCAMHHLEKMDRTEYQLRTKLNSLKYPEQIVAEAVSYVKKFRYVDDVRYAVNYLEYRKDSKSMRQLEQELYQKGISKETYRMALEEIEAPDEEAQIRQLLKKKNYRPGETDRKETGKIFNFLLRKGYSMSSIQHVMHTDSLYD